MTAHRAPRTAHGLFVTGTDTGVGKTLVACALLHALAGRGLRVVGMKPVAAGREADGTFHDVEALIAASSVAAPREWVNPYAFDPPIAPHVAAGRAGLRIELAPILSAWRGLSRLADAVVVEGVGGFRVPLNESEDAGDLAAGLGLPVILVVGLRLGCLNHALLTAQAVRAAGLTLAGWVANELTPGMEALEENIAALDARLGCPRLGRMAFLPRPAPALAAAALDLSGLPGAQG
jgi:dethiobiotin synthetase